MTTTGAQPTGAHRWGAAPGTAVRVQLTEMRLE